MISPTLAYALQNLGETVQEGAQENRHSTDVRMMKRAGSAWVTAHKMVWSTALDPSPCVVISIHLDGKSCPNLGSSA